MFTTMTALAAATLAGLAEPPNDPAAGIDSFKLTGIVRDFKSTHAEFQFGATGWIKGMVLEDLGPNGKPVLDVQRAESLNWDRKKVGSSSAEAFSEWFRDIPSVNVSMPLSITLEREYRDGNSIYVFSREGSNMFFPINSEGYGPSVINGAQWDKNFHFTFELDTTFTYTDPAERDAPLVFKFVGDDDVWVYINGKLAIDIGGVKGAK
ncbi:MAG: fibro-slime domain-containing protein, partial [Planctomycetota bacterium]